MNNFKVKQYRFEIGATFLFIILRFLVGYLTRVQGATGLVLIGASVAVSIIYAVSMVFVLSNKYLENATRSLQEKVSSSRDELRDELLELLNQNRELLPERVFQKPAFSDTLWV